MLFLNMTSQFQLPHIAVSRVICNMLKIFLPDFTGLKI